MNAVIYVRCSSSNQSKESIERQRRACKEYAEKNKITVICEYCDHALSGETGNRPQFQKMINDAATGKFDAVIVYTIDRFSRNHHDAEAYEAKLRENGVNIFCVKETLQETPLGVIFIPAIDDFEEHIEP